ncbi:cupin domain-containing protein [Caballeronia sp. 15711]|uniref:cupin domain-containing protein n=1 Tax=Caballeronia sp. 15711 TaxID=3391029 RepID=UPI0039E37FEF
MTTYVDRSRYLTLDQGFNLGRPQVPAHIFSRERDEALLDHDNSVRIPCDMQSVIGGDVEATAPLLLASYVRLKPGTPLVLKSGATSEIFYVIQGAGVTTWGDEQIRWQSGDVFLLPGGDKETHWAEGEGNAVLWQCTNEPQLAYEGALPPPTEKSRIQPTHYPKAAMHRALARAKKLEMKNGMKSMAIMLASESSKYGTITPSLTLALNSVAAGTSQIPHRHNSVAISLVLEGESCYSIVNGNTVHWSRFATFVTPGGASHSHHNESAGNALLLIVQDGGFYYHCRTMGFATVDTQAPS